MVAYAVSTDDAEYMPTSVVINGASCHTMHHLYFNYNYGQFTTAWDRLAGTYRKPKGDGFMESRQLDGKEKIGDKLD
jgi:lathosterol oxidase